MVRFLRALFGVLLVASCSTSGTGTDPIQNNQPVQLVIYSAPWCENCEPFIKAIKEQLNRLPEEKAALVKPEIRVVTGKNKTQKPTPEVAAEYADKLGVGFPAISDFWKTGTYGENYKKDVLSIPAAMIIISTGEKDIQKPGTPAEEVMAILEGVLR